MSTPLPYDAHSLTPTNWAGSGKRGSLLSTLLSDYARLGGDAHNVHYVFFYVALWTPPGSGQASPLGDTVAVDEDAAVQRCQAHWQEGKQEKTPLRFFHDEAHSRPYLKSWRAVCPGGIYQVQAVVIDTGQGVRHWRRP